MLEPPEMLQGSHARDIYGVWHIIDRAKVPFCTAPPNPRVPLQIIEQRSIDEGTPTNANLCQVCRRNRQIMTQTTDQEV